MLTTVKDGTSPRPSHVTSLAPTYLSSISLGELDALLADTEVLEPKECIDKPKGNIHMVPAKPSTTPAAATGNPTKTTMKITEKTVARNQSGVGTSTKLFAIPPAARVGAGGSFKTQTGTGSRAVGAGVDFGTAPTFGDGLFETGAIFGTRYAAGAVGAGTDTGARGGLGTLPTVGGSVAGVGAGPASESFLFGTAAKTGANPAGPTPAYRNLFGGTPAQNQPSSTSPMK